MTIDHLITTTEGELRELAATLTDVRERECLLCYVYRMLEFGCTGLRWATRYRDIRAPRATALEHRLGRMGGYCDCEIFMNAYTPHHDLWVRPPPDEFGCEYGPEWPEQMPPCQGAVAGSTKPCAHWVRGRLWW